VHSPTVGLLILSSLLVSAASVFVRVEARQTSSDTRPAAAQANEVILPSAEASKLLSAVMSFRGEWVCVELRNSSGIRFSDGMYLLTAVIDTSGHATGAHEKAYFKTDVPLDVRGHKLKPGVYRVGLDDHDCFIVMDVAAHPMFAVDSQRDYRLLRPRPLQIRSRSPTSGYRFYLGRDYVTLSRTGRPLQ
jgi:hypothetical protein